MRLFVIGNGFDLAHSLPTKYWNFRQYLEKVYPDFLDAFEEHYYIYPKDSDEYKKNLLWNDFETNLANINEDIIIENAIGIDMGLESGDVGIEDTLRIYFRDEYRYIDKLAGYLKQWIRTIRIRDVIPVTSQINKDNDDFFITFNYTSVLENIYQIDRGNVLHIHGSLHDYNDDPILGHGNIQRIIDIQAKREYARSRFDEKETSICTIINDYYNTTFKNVDNYMYKLNSLNDYKIDEVIVIGHSVAGIDIPYFKQIDEMTNRKLRWRVYYYNENEIEEMQRVFCEQNISGRRLELIDSAEFYDLRT